MKTLLPIIFMFLSAAAVFGQTDTTAPNVSNFGYFPSSVNVGSGAENVGVSLRGIDDLSGVDTIRVRFRSPSGNQTIDADFNSSWRVSGDEKNGLYNNTVVFTQASEIGTWVVDFIYVRDEAGNEKFIYTDELMTLGFRTRFQVTAIACTYTLNPSSQDFPASGGFGVAVVITQMGCTASLTGTSSFIFANSISGAVDLTTGIAVVTVPFSVYANPGEARTGTITISGQTFTVNQAGTKSRKRVRFF